MLHGALRRWAWLLILGLGVGAIAAYLVATGSVASQVLYTGIGLVSTATVVVGVRMHRPAAASGWLLIAGGNLLAVGGDVVLAYYDLVLHTDTPLPSWADLLYLAGYPLMFAGILRLSRGSSNYGAREGTTDAAIVLVAALAVSWRFLMSAYADDPSISTWATIVSIAYPVMDVAILWVVVRSLLISRRRTVAQHLLTLAMVMLLVADFVYDGLVVHGLYRDGDLIDAAWLLNYLLVAAAALHPSMAAPASQPRVVSNRVWVPIVVVAGLTVPSILVVDQLQGRTDSDVGLFAVLFAVVFVLVVLRGSWLLARVNAQHAELVDRAEMLQQALAARGVLEADLRHQAFHDSLTGLPNRSLMHDHVERALIAMRPGQAVAVCFCDLDQFQTLNDGLGLGLGDQVLQAVAMRLLSALGPGDTVARLGGDEFAILLTEVDSCDDVGETVERLLAAVREPLTVAGQSVHVTASIGVVVENASSSSTASAVFADADAAMYEAKAAGRDTYRVFEHGMRARITDRAEMIAAFRTALSGQQFVVEYQPSYDLATGGLEGFEALVRWNHPTMGRISPAAFVPLAEETGFIVPLGLWVLETACRAAATWMTRTGSAYTVAVNLSARQLQSPQIYDDVCSVLSFTGLPARHLVLEVTESALMTDPEQASNILGRLRSLGVRIAIDDFGTGHSSLSYLRQFPVDILKIDKSFVDPLVDRGHEGAAFVTTIVRLARQLGLATIAEGIEHHEQRVALTALGCESAQGYYFSRPVGAENARLLAETASLDSNPRVPVQ